MGRKQVAAVRGPRPQRLQGNGAHHAVDVASPGMQPIMALNDVFPVDRLLTYDGARVALLLLRVHVSSAVGVLGQHASPHTWYVQ